MASNRVPHAQSRVDGQYACQTPHTCLPRFGCWGASAASIRFLARALPLPVDMASCVGHWVQHTIGKSTLLPRSRPIAMLCACTRTRKGCTTHLWCCHGRGHPGDRPRGAGARRHHPVGRTDQGRCLALTIDRLNAILCLILLRLGAPQIRVSRICAWQIFIRHEHAV